MKQLVTWYNVGILVLFVGLLWMFLPHTAHAQILLEESGEHYIHLVEGVVITVLGIGILWWSSQSEKNKNN